MADHDDHDEFEGADSGAAECYPQQCSALRKNGYVMIKGRPCKIVEMSTSKTGKHGHAKVHLVALDIFTGKKYEDICPSTHNMDVPHVKRLEWQVISIDDDGYVTLMDDQGSTREDLKVTGDCDVKEDDVKKMIDEAEDSGKFLMASVWSAVGEEMIKGVSIKGGN